MKTINTTVTAKKVQIFNRYTNRPLVSGQIFKQKSMTIPGQDLTPQEIMRRFTQGAPPVNQLYIEENLSSFDKMHVLDKMDYMRDLQVRNQAMKNEIQLELNVLQKKADKEARLQADEKIRQSVIDEYKSKDKT